MLICVFSCRNAYLGRVLRHYVAQIEGVHPFPANQEAQELFISLPSRFRRRNRFLEKDTRESFGWIFIERMPNLCYP